MGLLFLGDRRGIAGGGIGIDRAESIWDGCRLWLALSVEDDVMVDGGSVFLVWRVLLFALLVLVTSQVAVDRYLHCLWKVT